MILCGFDIHAVFDRIVAELFCAFTSGGDMSDSHANSMELGELALIELATVRRGELTFVYYEPRDVEGFVSDVNAVFSQPDADPILLLEELELLEERGRVTIDRFTTRERSSGSKGKVIPSAVSATVQLA